MIRIVLFHSTTTSIRTIVVIAVIIEGFYLLVAADAADPSRGGMNGDQECGGDGGSMLDDSEMF